MCGYYSYSDPYFFEYKYRFKYKNINLNLNLDAPTWIWIWFCHACLPLRNWFNINSTSMTKWIASREEMGPAWNQRWRDVIGPLSHSWGCHPYSPQINKCVTRTMVIFKWKYDQSVKCLGYNLTYSVTNQNQILYSSIRASSCMYEYVFLNKDNTLIKVGWYEWFDILTH